MLQAYMYHKHLCPKSKKQLSWALGKAKEAWKANKHHKMEETRSSSSVAAELPLDDALPGVLEVSFLPSHHHHLLKDCIFQVAETSV